MNKKKALKLNQIKEFLLKKGLIIIKKKRVTFFSEELRSLYLTALCGLCIIVISFTLPIISDLKKNIFFVSKEIENNSKSNFEKVLDGESLKKDSNMSKNKLF